VQKKKNPARMVGRVKFKRKEWGQSSHTIADGFRVEFKCIASNMEREGRKGLGCETTQRMLVRKRRGVGTHFGGIGT